MRSCISNYPVWSLSVQFLGSGQPLPMSSFSYSHHDLAAFLPHPSLHTSSCITSMKSQLVASPCGKASTAPVNYAMRSYGAAAWHKAVAGMQNHEWPGSGSQGACDWLQRQGQLVKDAKVTVQEDGGCGTQDFRSHSQPNWYHLVCRYCFAPLHLTPCSCSLGT